MTRERRQGVFYRDLDLELRAVRDNLTSEVSKVIIDDRKKLQKKTTAFINQFMPKFKKRKLSFTISLNLSLMLIVLISKISRSFRA